MFPKMSQPTHNQFLAMPRSPILYVCPQCNFSRFVGNRWEGDVLSLLPSHHTICPICEVGMKVLSIEPQEAQQVLQDITLQDFKILQQICTFNPPIDEFGCCNHRFIDFFNDFFPYRFMQKQSSDCRFSSISRFESYEYFCSNCGHCQPRKELDEKPVSFLGMQVKIPQRLCPNCKNTMQVRQKKNLFKTLWDFTKGFSEIPSFSKPICVYICPSCKIIVPLRPSKYACKQCGYSEPLKNQHKVTIDDVLWVCPQCQNKSSN